MLGAGAIILMMILALVHFNPLMLFADAEQKYTAKYLLPGNYLKNPFDQISLGLGYTLGLAGPPPLIKRVLPVAHAQTAPPPLGWGMFLPAARFPGTTAVALAAATSLRPDR